MKLSTLKSRRSMLSTLFVLSLIRFDVDSEFLLIQLKFNVAVRPTLSFRRACRTFNEYANK